MLQPISKVLLHFLNDTATIHQGQVVITDTSPVNLYGDGFPILPLIKRWQNEKGKWCAATCEPLGGCLEKEGYNWVTFNPKKVGILFFEDRSLPKVTYNKENCVIVKPTILRLIWWGDKEKLGVDACCDLSSVLIPHFISKFPKSACDFLINTDVISSVNCGIGMDVEVSKFEVVGCKANDPKIFSQYHIEDEWLPYIHPKENFWIDIAFDMVYNPSCIEAPSLMAEGEYQC